MANKILNPFLESYYSKHKEDHRLETRHGFVEFSVSMMHIIEEIDNFKKKSGLSEKEIRILDLGAGTGRYSVALSQMGFDVTAVELTKHNCEILENKHEKIKIWQGDARNVDFLEDEAFDFTILFGPLYHLHGDEDKLKTLKEARRVTKRGGKIFIAYVMNDYSILTYCFMENRMPSLKENGSIDESFHVVTTEKDLYDYVRLEDLDRLNKKMAEEFFWQRTKIFSPDGPADFMRRQLNAMSEESFKLFIEYQKINGTRTELLGAGSHLVDVIEV